MDETRIIAAILASGILTKGTLSNTEADARYAVLLFQTIERLLRHSGDPDASDTAASVKS
jgi:hypothetical protein